MRTVSWILLMLVGVLTLWGSLESSNVAYRPHQDRIAGVTVTDLAAGKPDVEAALRGRRGTAAAYAAGFATLFLFVALFPYRRGERWAWWAILVGTLVVAVLVLLRIPALGVALRSPSGGTAIAALIQLGVVAIALALGAGRFQKRPAV